MPRSFVFPPLPPPSNNAPAHQSQVPLLALPPPPRTNPSGSTSPGQAIVLRQSWWKLNQEKLDRVYDFMAFELEARQETIREKERLLKEIEEKQKVKEAEEKALSKMKERQEFEERIGTIVGSKINDASELFLGRADQAKATTASGEVGRRIGPEKTAIKHLDAEKELMEKQIGLLRQEHEFIKKRMEELARTMKQTSTGTKRPATGVCITSPPEAPARGKSKVMGVGTPTSQDFEKLLKAYNTVKEGKRIADMEVHTLRERFEKAVSKLVRQGRTPRANLTRRMYEATDDDEQEIPAGREEGLDDLTLRPSPPKRTSGRLAMKAAVAEKAEFVKETKKYLKRLKKHGLQMLCAKEGVTFITCRTSNY
ncbi:hypothetical protein CBR_g40316 [Chara braunii]|uniref:Uncharacterized protein n=1 Tax=Chara braunii TaxID=69332 RepID=A0A388LTE8_CHABU|nr:hypothetical protein CBR_g40316 [Chara braunii]|eukprot:GBG85587.1 hypothetical protein CBR_g40316 [Chara braunii]